MTHKTRADLMELEERQHDTEVNIIRDALRELPRQQPNNLLALDVSLEINTLDGQEHLRAELCAARAESRRGIARAEDNQSATNLFSHWRPRRDGRNVREQSGAELQRGLNNEGMETRTTQTLRSDLDFMTNACHSLDIRLAASVRTT